MGSATRSGPGNARGTWPRSRRCRPSVCAQSERRGTWHDDGMARPFAFPDFRLPGLFLAVVIGGANLPDRCPALAAASRLAARQPGNWIAASGVGRDPDRDHRLSSLEPGHLVGDLRHCHDTGGSSSWTKKRSTPQHFFANRIDNYATEGGNQYPRRSRVESLVKDGTSGSSSDPDI